MLTADTLAPAFVTTRTGRACSVLHTTGERRIGKHNWRAAVICDPAAGRNFITYQWRYEGGRTWHEAHHWPAFDFDRFNFGLPAGLASLYDEELPILARFLPRAAEHAATRAARNPIQQVLPI